MIYLFNINSGFVKQEQGVNLYYLVNKKLIKVNMC